MRPPVEVMALLMMMLPPAFSVTDGAQAGHRDWRIDRNVAIAARAVAERAAGLKHDIGAGVQGRV